MSCREKEEQDPGKTKPKAHVIPRKTSQQYRGYTLPALPVPGNTSTSQYVMPKLLLVVNPTIPQYTILKVPFHHSLLYNGTTVARYKGYNHDP